MKVLLKALLVLLSVSGAIGFLASKPSTAYGIQSSNTAIVLHAEKIKTIGVAGASSSVGYIVFKKLLRKKQYNPIGIVRDIKGVEVLRNLGANESQIRICDVTVRSSLEGTFNGVDKVVICISATPLRKFTFKVRSFFRKVFRRPQRSPRSHEMYYSENERPYDVDYIGQKNIIDECVKAKVKHIVLLGNMGGYRGSRLNDIGRIEGDPDVKNGNILKWKRAAERYLMKRSFFTIVHAAQLTDDKGGEKEIIWDTDDRLTRTEFRRVSREDAAEVLVQSLGWKESIGKSIDIANRPLASGETFKPMDWLRFWSQPGTCIYPSDSDDHLFR